MPNAEAIGSSSLVLLSAYAGLHSPLAASVLISILAAFLTYKCIPICSAPFIKAGLFGKDLLKKDRPMTPESMGAIAGLIYFMCLFLFIPVPFLPFFTAEGLDIFPHDKLGQFLAALLSLLSMVFLGFADDVLDIRWRVKIWMPLFASLPLLMVYYVTYGVTHVVVPQPLRSTLGANIIDLGILYYGYMAALCIFCTNSINILAGVNGIEGGQSLVIAISMTLNSIYQVVTTSYPTTREVHLNSIYFLLPFIGVTVGYLKHNWYPAKCFGGDTYAYFAGMIFAVVSIQNHFSKTTLLFMLPQIFNFVYSCPQLFHFVECPRHRMPKLDIQTHLIHASRAPLDKTGRLGLGMIRFLELLSLVHVNRDTKGHYVDCSNLTLINLILIKSGPLKENELCKRVLIVQSMATVVAFIIRYGLVGWWYPQ